MFLSLSLLLVLCGCDFFPSLPSIPSIPSIPTTFKEPNISLSSVEVVGVSLGNVNLVATVEVENPNSYALPMPKIDWELFVTDISFDTGIVEENISVGSGEKYSMDIPISLNQNQLISTALSHYASTGSRELPYTIATKLQFTTVPFLANRIFPLNKTDSIPLSQIPGLDLPW